MTKTINLELSKRLAPYLENIVTEYFYFEINGNFIKVNVKGNIGYTKGKNYKTPNLEELINIIGKGSCHFTMLYPNGGLWNSDCVIGNDSFKSETILGLYEQFTIYLLDNNLLTK